MLIFDLDGTLSNPLEGIARAINHALERHSYPVLEHAQVAPYIGPPLEGTFRALTGGNRDLVLQLVASYRECYRESCIENTVYDGVPAALEALRLGGVPLGVCTSKRADFAERILEHLGLRHYFAFVSGGDIGIEKWQQLAALKASGTLAPDTVMIGDRAVDIQAGKRNGLRTGGVLWGFGDHAELSAEQPDALFRHPQEWVPLHLNASGQSF